VLGYEIELDLSIEELPEDQHGSYQWLDIVDMLSSAEVHKHSKWYVEV
jgi:colanic acid biosynthesis protein WcaH